MEEKPEEVEDIEASSSDSFLDDDSEDDGPSTSGRDENGLHTEAPLSEEDIEDLIAELLEVESKAAEAQETLEKESLAKVETDVREELSQTLQGEELDTAVADEMTTYVAEWETVLDELETESAHLQEQLDGAGIELSSVFKWIESQAPKSCSTEAWQRRIHWVGSQVSNDLSESKAHAEEFLQTNRPVRRKHGKLLEEGASGFLTKKLAVESNDTTTKNLGDDWSSMNKLFSEGAPEGSASFGTTHWASVYLASTPQQAAELGLKFPGIDEVEEIDDIDGDSTDPFVAAAVAHEKELALSEEQKKNFRKVREEDDAKVDRKLQNHLKRRRYRKRFKQGFTKREIDITDELTEIDFDKSSTLVDESASILDKKNHKDGEFMCTDHDGFTTSGNVDKASSPANGTPSILKRPSETIELGNEYKRSRTMVIDDDEPQANDSAFKKSDLKENVGQVNASPLSSQRISDEFHCTACDRIIIEVHAHPTLKVIICADCRSIVEEKMKAKDRDCSQCFCGWCGRTKDLLNCTSCKTLFCMTCIKRNTGAESVPEVKSTSWQCFSCLPAALQKLTSELEKAMECEQLVVSSSDSDSESDSSEEDSDDDISAKKRKKGIRRILDDAELGEETKRKIAIEKERQERLKALQDQFSAKSKVMNSEGFNGNLSEDASTEVLGDASTGYIVNVVREKGEEAVRIPPSISAKLKVHQVKGIRFMWENIVQSVRKVKCGDKGLGCILAHTMGLGKTLQVIAFLYTAMRCIDLGLRTALIVVPVNVLHNWKQEFLKWMPSEVKSLRIFMLEDLPRERRGELFAKWRKKGGVFLVGYASLRNLFLGKSVKDRNVAKEICYALQDGTDILVCDEAHVIKNTKAEVTQALKQVKCQRRIALTGSPLQNNLMEYYCMVDFVREGFLGSSHEFRNRFQNPIENGQHTNSTLVDVKIMNQRSHILYEQLKGFVQRMDMNVVKNDLPPKTVFVIAVKLSPLQRKLYKKFLDVHGFTKDSASNEGIRKRSFFAGYQALAQIWNHPGILQLKKDDKDSVRREEAIENFLADESSSDENMDYNMVFEEKQKSSNVILPGKSSDAFIQKGWWNDLIQGKSYKELEYSGKMVLLFEILAMSSDMGDKALVFSQSIPTLDVIELYLSKLPRKDKKKKFWKKRKDWYRLDGRTESSERQKMVEKFNNPSNKRVKCCLISTRAGSLGINLHAANRVIIFDGSWNPTYDLQAIYRAWRYGQRKPVFAYRLMAHGTMEEKIYKRQVTKESLAARVVDRQQVHRTISKEEMLHLFEFGDEEIPENLVDLDEQSLTAEVGTFPKQKMPVSQGSCSSDKVMETLLSKHSPSWIANYHEHETLLQENEEERLSKEEQDMAWEVYRRTFEWEEVPQVPPVNPASAPKQPTPRDPPEPSSPVQPSERGRPAPRKCTNLAHLLTLRSQGTKSGCTTVCGECAQVLSWDILSAK